MLANGLGGCGTPVLSGGVAIGWVGGEALNPKIVNFALRLAGIRGGWWRGGVLQKEYAVC